MDKEAIRKTFNEMILRIDHLIIKQILDPAKYENKFRIRQGSYVSFNYENEPSKRINYERLILTFIKNCLTGESLDGYSYRAFYNRAPYYLDLNCLIWEFGETFNVFGDDVLFVDEEFDLEFYDFIVPDNQDATISECYVDWPMDKVEAEIKNRCSKLIDRFKRDNIDCCKIISLESLKNLKDEREKQILDLYNKYLTPNRFQLLYVDNFIFENVPQQVFEYFKKKREELINYVEKLRTSDGLKDIITRNWNKLKFDLIDYFEYHKLTFLGCDFTGEPIVDKYGVINFILTLDINNDLCINWLVLFLSSDYLSNCLGFVEMADNTFVVSGYLKSVETLMVHLIIEHAKENHYLPKVMFIDERGRTKTIFINSNIASSSTVGKIEKYVRYSDTFISDTNYKNKLVNMLENWREKVRNGYFHKHLIASQQDLDDVKKETMDLTRFILDHFFGNGPKDELEYDGEGFLERNDHELPF